MRSPNKWAGVFGPSHAPRWSPLGSAWVSVALADLSQQTTGPALVLARTSLWRDRSQGRDIRRHGTRTRTTPGVVLSPARPTALALPHGISCDGGCQALPCLSAAWWARPVRDAVVVAWDQRFAQGLRRPFRMDEGCAGLAAGHVAAKCLGSPCDGQHEQRLEGEREDLPAD